MSSPGAVHGARYRAVSLVVGVGAVVVGIALTLRPFRSLDALTLYIAVCLALAGMGELLASGSASSPWVDRIVGGLLVLTGLVAALAPGLTVRATATVVGVGMVLTGVARIVAGARGDVQERYAAVVGGLAALIVGVLALAWSDVTILVIAFLVGPVAIVYGARQILHAVRGQRVKTSGERSRLRVWSRAIGLTAALLLAVVLAVVSASVNRASPTVSSFYTWSGSLPNRPGVLLREQATTREIPAGAHGLRILYTTTAINGTITVASGLVVAPSAGGETAKPVLLWEHGTTGVAPKCAPSVLAAPFTAGAMFVAGQVLSHGWVLVAPDYLGLGASPPHPYLVGLPEARSSLDAVRAARRLNSIKLNGQTVVWGHSQGGGAALWTAIEARRYAPDVPLSGVAALAPASDLVSFAHGLEASPAGMLFASFMVAGYSDAYRDVSFNDYVRQTAQAVVRRVVDRCLSEPATLLSLPAVLAGEPIFSRGLTTGALGARLAQNVPLQPSHIPTLIAQGQADPLVLPGVQRSFADRLCNAGQPLEYRAYAGLDHVALVQPTSPLIPYLLTWTTARFNGHPAPDNCATLTNAASP